MATKVEFENVDGALEEAKIFPQRWNLMKNNGAPKEVQRWP